MSVPEGRAQSILREYWLGLPGSSIADLVNAPAYPNSPSGSTFPTIFEGPSAFSDNYGTRFRGFVKPPTTGNYRFWVAGDDQCELWLSTDESPTGRTRIASVNSWTNSREWTKEPNQQSALIALTAGRRYYIEALQKEGGGGDAIAVGWQLPNGALERPIPGSRLEPFQLSQDPPTIKTQPADVTVFEGQEARFTVSASGLEPLTFQWQRDGMTLPIERSATVILPVTQMQDNGAKFICVITNPKGTTNTREAVLTVRAEITPPLLFATMPAQGAIVRSLRQVEVTFTEPVTGVDAADLLINGQAATNVTGGASGPYIFQFEPAASGVADIRFASNAAIKDYSLNQNAFAGASWSATVDPNAPVPKIRISEINTSNETGLADENAERVDWIELENFGTTAINLNGWSLSDSASFPGQWVFPNVTVNAGQRLIVFASGKDRRTAGMNLHANFLLSGGGEYLGLFDANSPRNAISEMEYPEQRVDISYGYDPAGQLRYFVSPTPSAPNGTSSIVGILPPPHFSSERGFFSSAFQVHLTTEVPGAEIRITTNGNDPAGATGRLYTNALQIATTTILRASVVKTNYLPSAPATHTYIYNATAQRRSLPALSIVAPTNHLFGPTGIIGIGGGTYGGDGVWRAVNPGDYHNPTKHGIAWERATSLELFYPTNNLGFQIDAGIRVQGSDYMRPRYTPSSKFSYRFYFRGDYGEGELEYPLFDSPVTTFDQLVLRAGHNDDTNPFLKDELMRRLFIDVGQVGSHGMFTTMYLNGQYKGYYNLVERIEKHFMQDWHGGEEEWDVLTQNQQALDGDNVNFSSMVNYIRNNPMTNSVNYLQAMRRLDFTNFVDYLLVNIYGANGDWPGNNWRAARERSDNGIWRFYLWDAEFSFGTYGQTPSHDSFGAQLAEGSEIPSIYQALRRSPEFQLFWADRVNKHFYNGGALTDSNITRNFNVLRSQLTNIITAFDNSILNTWIPNRRRTITNHFRQYNLAGAPGAPSFNQFSGRVAAGFQLTMSTIATGATVNVYFTTNGTDPRVMFTSAVSPQAVKYTAPVTLNETRHIKARMHNGTNWSALTEATFEVSQFGAPLRFTEVMYNPPGGDAYEYVELKNFSAAPIDLGGMSFNGISYRFPDRTLLPAGETVLLASGFAPNLFTNRYKGAVISGYFENTLANGGERIELLDRQGNIITWVNFDDERGWPLEADGNGHSLELVDREIDPLSPAAWRRSADLLGSPGVYNSSSAIGVVRLSEIMSAQGAAQAWIELHNESDATVDVGGYSLGDLNSARLGVFAAGTTIPARGYLVRAQFPIGLPGGTVMLYDANTNRIDGVVLGRQLAGNSVARVDGVWTLATPTIGEANVAAPLAPASALAINEWLANPVAGADDWLELYNSAVLPVALQGVTLAVSNSVYRIPTITFIPAGGFLQLFASEKLGADHLSFKLPAAGGTIRLYDQNGVLVNSAAYSAQLEGVSEGRLPNATGAVTKFRGSASPGASNYALSASSSLVINEVMARNVRAVIDPAGNASDWIELYNSVGTVSLDGLSLSTDPGEPGQWRFPPGLSLAAGEYLVVWFDKTRLASSAPGYLNTGAALAAEGGGVYLFNATGQVIDSVEFGLQAPNLSIGRSNASWQLLSRPTPGAVNATLADLGSPTSLRINEWNAGFNGPAWMELHNSGTTSLPLAGVSLTDELSLAGVKKFVLPPLTFLGPKGFARWTAAGDSAAQPGEINFNISAYGESLRVYSASGTVIDTVTFGMMPAGGFGRYPNSTGVVIAVEASIESPNHLPLTAVIINEVMPAENLIELRNTTNADLDMSGWFVSNDPLTPDKVALPAGSVIPARGYLLLSFGAQAQLDASFGGTVLLASASNGALTGEQTRFVYGPTAAGGAFGPLRTFTGVQAVRLQSGTPGAANASAAVGPVVINEVMYDPANDELDFEYIELLNASASSMTTIGLRINGGVQFNFPGGFTFQAGERVIIVPFDPDLDASAKASFMARYSVPAATRLLGPLRGKLSNGGDEIVLETPLRAAADGYVGYVALDSVKYSNDLPWPAAAAGTGPALHRISANLFGNDPLNWVSATASPGAAPENRPVYDRDVDGMPDTWEIAFGLDIYAAQDAVTDLDGDGLSNITEFQMGSDPSDASSGFSLNVTSNGAGPALNFNAAANMTYKIEARDSLTEGAWGLDSTHGPFDTARTVTVPLIKDGATQRYYRLVR